MINRQPKKRSGLHGLRIFGEAVAIGLATLTAAPARADLISLKQHCVQKDAKDSTGAPSLPFLFCDDGLPPLGIGGRTPNVGAQKAVAVPEKYTGFKGLPSKAPADSNSGADSNGDIALDVDVSLPDPTMNPPPSGGYPLIVMVHGCCWGDKTTWEADTIDPADERWHYNNAWFASRGYVVLTYTSRGFVDSLGRGSTGETQIDSRLYEVNDLQYLSGVLADDPFFNINPQKIVVTGGSMGGGLTWLTLTDPEWKSPGGKPLRVIAAAPKYGWTDLLYSLVPTGTHLRDSLPPPDPIPNPPENPFGFVKQSIATGFVLQGIIGLPVRGFSHATFQSWLNDSYVCLNLPNFPFPIETNPLCSTFRNSVAPGFLADRSAYYQNDFFKALTNGAPPVPVFSAGTLTDPLFTAVEHREMIERLKAAVSGYPVQEYYGDYAHFVQDKVKEWADVCASDHHVCLQTDYQGDLNKDPPDLVSEGVNTMVDRFIDHYAAPPGDATAPQPPFNVTASLQICPANASAAQPKDEPGPRFTAAKFSDLAPNSLKITTSCSHGLGTSNIAGPNLHALNSDPMLRFLTGSAGGDFCSVETNPAGSGVATYDSDTLPNGFTMIGRTRVTIIHKGQGSGIQLNARMYDVFPDKRAVMVDRGVSRVTPANGKTLLDLNGNGWLFPAQHKIRLELAQDDSLYIKHSEQPSSLTIGDPVQHGIAIEIPVREAGTQLSGTCN
jgi:acetyl esterase/lipase